MRQAVPRIPVRTGLALSFAAALTLPGMALACAFHNYLPQKTVVDLMMESDDIVLARPDPDNPFRYEAVEAIEGRLDWVEIPFLVDSSSRRRLAANPTDMVLFARDGAYGPWQRLAYLDTGYGPVLREIVDRLPEWEAGEPGDRFQFFADLHAHPASAVRRLALAELDRAPYGTLRNLHIEIDAESLDPGAYRLSDYPYLPIRILLLGLSGDDAAREVLQRGLATQAALPSGSLLGAYATALVELDGADGVVILADLLGKGTLSPDAGESIVEALAIHAEAGDEGTRSAVHAAVEAVVRDRPSLGASVARQFGSRGEYRHADLVDEGRRAGAFSSVRDLFAVAQYIGLSQKDRSEAPRPQ